MLYIKAKKLTQKKQVLCGLRVLFLIFNCQTPDQTAAAATNIIHFHGISAMIIWPLSFALPAAYRAAGDAKACMYTSIVSMWIFRIGFSYLVGKYMGLGVFGVWVAMVIDWVVRAICFVIRYFNGKWKHGAIV